MLEKIYCPICNRGLIRLEPYEDPDTVYTYWCDECNFAITLEDYRARTVQDTIDDFDDALSTVLIKDGDVCHIFDKEDIEFIGEDLLARKVKSTSVTSYESFGIPTAEVMLEIHV